MRRLSVYLCRSARSIPVKVLPRDSFGADIGLRIVDGVLERHREECAGLLRKINHHMSC